MENFASLAGQYWHVAIVGFLLFVITIGFFAKFVFPAISLGKILSTALDELQSIKDGLGGTPPIELSLIADGPMRNEILAHTWSEYAENLHPQREDGNDGQSRIARWRATAIAETFFTEQVLVDTPLKTEFYKHLPGILTGLGIIGTFTGLIMGLVHFDVSLDANRAQLELRNLVNSVGHAFVVSATAIGLAMLFTWIEKSLVTARYRQVEQLAQLIDSLFDAGAGEEYLARLVVASETQATQAIYIKEAIVADLREILTSIAERQMEAQQRQTGQLSVDIGKAISEHLGGPITDIAASVKGVSSNQGEAVNKLLTDVLSSFSAQMQDMFGGQMRGMSDLLRETSEAMRATANRFEVLASGMENAGTGAIEAMGERLNHAITSMEARQQIMNKHMGEFVAQIQNLISDSQSQSSRKLQETLGVIGEQVAGVVAELRRQAEESAVDQGRRQQSFEDSSRQALGSLSQQVESLLAQSTESNRSLHDVVSKLTASTENAISGLNQGAETLYVAASDFARAGDGVSETMRSAVAVVAEIKATSATLSSAAISVKEVLADYSRTRDSFNTLVAELNSIIDLTKRDASMTSDIIRRIEAAAEQLAAAQKQSEDYLLGINNVLVKAHEAFAENVERTLRESNKQFQRELGDAVNLVSAAVKELGDTLDELPSKV